LDANKVKYDKLIMLDLPNMKARQENNCHGTHKANEYKLNNYNLFVESDLGQAIEINRITKKPVFCTENFKMIYESESLVYNIKSGKYVPFLRAFLLKVRTKIRRIKKNRIIKNKLKVNTNEAIIEQINN
jgi:hypothetical protein